MAVTEGTLETEFLRAGRESGEGQQEPYPCEVPGACEDLLSWGRLSKNLLDDHALMFDALRFDVLLLGAPCSCWLLSAVCCGYPQVTDSLVIFSSDPLVTIRQNT